MMTAMKTRSILMALTATVLLSGCNYLDVDPELGLTEEDVFSTYKNYRLYFDYIYSTNTDFTYQNIHEGFPLYVDFNDRRFTFASTTDMADAGRLLRAQQEVKICKLAQETCNDFSFSSRRPIAMAMFCSARPISRAATPISC